jgi:glycosyltransferase involved in cell wall biosynthesis
MKICVISSTVFPCPPPGYSGLEQLAWQIAEGLGRKGHDVVLVAPNGSKCQHAQVIHTGEPGRHDERQAYSVYREQLDKFDVIIDHSWWKFAYLPRMTGELKSPVLGVCHAPVNTMYQTIPDIPKPSFVCISEDQANHFEALFSRKPKVARNGVDPMFYQPISGIPREDKFLFLARFSSIKGADIAVKTCKELNVRLDLVGDTTITNEPEYLEQVKGDCDGELIRMVGPASRGECVHHYSRANVFLHPNKRFREPLGLAPIEAQLCGLPVIAWDYGALRETVKNGETGVLVNDEEEFKRVVSNWSQISIDDGFRYRCREWASQFNVQKMIDRYQELCQIAVDEGGW